MERRTLRFPLADRDDDDPLLKDKERRLLRSPWCKLWILSRNTLSHTPRSLSESSESDDDDVALHSDDVRCSPSDARKHVDGFSMAHRSVSPAAQGITQRLSQLHAALDSAKSNSINSAAKLI